MRKCFLYFEQRENNFSTQKPSQSKKKFPVGNVNEIHRFGTVAEWRITY